MRILFVEFLLFAIAQPVDAQQLAPDAYARATEAEVALPAMPVDSARKLSLGRHIWIGSLVGVGVTALGWGIAAATGELSKGDACIGCVFVVPITVGIGAGGGALGGALVYLIRRSAPRRPNPSSP